MTDMVKKSFNRIQVMYEELQTVGDPELFKSNQPNDSDNNSPVSNFCLFLLLSSLSSFFSNHSSMIPTITKSFICESLNHRFKTVSTCSRKDGKKKEEKEKKKWGLEFLI